MTVVRSGLFNGFFFLSTFTLAVLGAPVLFITPRRMLAYARMWARLELAALRAICGIRFEVIGRENLPVDGPALIASRHQSAFDTLVWLNLVPRCAYIFKEELLGIPIFGRMMLAAGMIPVDREAGPASVRALARRAEKAMRDGRQMIIFPEGTRAEFGHPRSLQPGIAALAFRTGLPICPVATNSGLFWGRRAFRKHAGTIRIVIGEAIPPGLPRPVLMERLRTALQDSVGQPEIVVDNSVGTIPGRL